MVKRHLKRLAIPKSWDIKKKGIKFTTRPSAGAHSFELGMPINIILRDMLKYSHSNREVKKIMDNKQILVDGKIRKNHRLIVGFMDVISAPKIKEHFRVILNKKGKLSLLHITEQEAKLKICRISGKKKISGKTQLNLLDSRNILIEKDPYKVGDSIVIEIPSQKIKDHLKLEKNSVVFIMGGKNTGKLGKVENIIGRIIICKDNSGLFEVPFDYVYVVGKDKPSLKVE